MTQPGKRMLNGEEQPDERSLSAWLGDEDYRRWTHVAGFIEDSYPGVFAPEWLFGGKKHGWGLRYRKSRSFCTLIPERKRLMIQLVFGEDERAKVEAVLPELASHTREEYEAATTYHDGKWLLLAVDADDVLADVERLLAIKRRPSKRLR